MVYLSLQLTHKINPNFSIETQTAPKTNHQYLTVTNTVTNRVLVEDYTLSYINRWGNRFLRLL